MRRSWGSVWLHVVRSCEAGLQVHSWGERCNCNLQFIPSTRDLSGLSADLQRVCLECILYQTVFNYPQSTAKGKELLMNM